MEAPARILVVEADTAMARVVARLLEQAGYEVFSRRTLRQALDVLATEGADLVIAGLQLPDQRGLPVITALRSGHATVPIVAVYGGNIRPNPDTIVAAGAASALRRPFGPQALFRAVAGVLSTSFPVPPLAPLPPPSPDSRSVERGTRR